MAANASKTPLIRLLAKRNFAASAKPAPSASSEIQVSTLPNKVVVASAEGFTPGLAKVSVAFRAGSRYETPDNFGVSHVLRSSAGLSTHNATQFAITRHLQQLGASLSATSDRESVIYTIEATIDHLEDTLRYLNTVATEQEFRPWELSDNLERLKVDLASIPPQAMLVDMLHKAAYRTTLGNSIFAKEYNLKKIGTETLQHYVKENFSGSKAAVSGVGVPHSMLVGFAEQLNLEPGSESCGAAAKYHGGEVRLDAHLNEAHVAVACEAASLQKKEVFTWAVLAQTLGGRQSVPYGEGASVLRRAVRQVPGARVAAVALPHSDSGLMAVAVTSAPGHSAQAVNAVAKALKGSVSDADVARGKACLRAELLLSAESSDALHADMTTQALLVGNVSAPPLLSQAIDAVTTDQVNEALRKLSSSKKSLAALGNIHNTPYLDEL